MPRHIHIRKHDLAIALQKVESAPNPKASLEQYPIPADMAAEILFTACYTHDDIEGRRVLDLGTGTGRLAIGASILNAEYVVAVDIDLSTLTLAHKAAKSIGAAVDFVLGEIETIGGSFDVVIMNPPFGTKKTHADLRFLQHALRVARVVYSIHKSSTRNFLAGWFREREVDVEMIATTRMEIPHQFEFHRKPKGWVEVDLIRVSGRQ